MKFKSSIFLLLNIIYPLFVLSQEVLIPLEGNAVLENHSKHEKRTKGVNAVDTLELPFFDDFSKNEIYPNPDLWSDKNVYINQSFAKEPPSVGVATFDAIDWKGDFYSEAGYGKSYSSDTLTSNPINLNYPGNKSIYLSFFYQPKGYGDFPEVNDSLILEFFSPETQKWDTVWKKTGDTISHFRQKLVQVWPEKYLKKGFRFRFRNIVSLASDQQPSRTVNADHWNIDYVKLDKNRSENDTILNDIAFLYPLHSVLYRYESMPWKHFKANTVSELNETVSSVYRNNSNVTRLIIGRYFIFYDHKGNFTNDTIFGGAQDEDPGFRETFETVFDYPFLSASEDSASFTVKSLFVTDTEDPASNNEIIYKQQFIDYYSYDDGSAEAGYGLIGEGTQNALLAYKFDCKVQDTLKAVQMYFNKSLNDASKKYFYLTIWNDNNGEPGEIIYKREGVRPEYENELNKFHTYFIDDTTLVLKGVFYVGWQQTTPDLLNVGFDFNTIHKDKSNRIINNIFYNINGLWKNSQFTGELMIRTFFGKSLTTSVKPLVKKYLTGVKIFPNPTQENIAIQINNLSEYKQFTVSIYNLSGSLVHQSLQNNNSSINLSRLPAGTYILQLTDQQKIPHYTCKLLKLN